MKEHQSRSTYFRKPSELIIDGPNCLLNCFFERSSNAHNLSHTLHAATEQTTDTVEFFEIPTRDLDDDIVQAGFEAGTGDFCDRVLDFVKGNS